MPSCFNGLPQAAGIGLKPAHFERLLGNELEPALPCWVELHPQNYFCAGGPPHRWLGAIADRYPLSFHSTGLSLGSADDLDARQLDLLVELVARYEPASVSDHLSWSAFERHAVPDLLPLPYTRVVLDHVAAQVERAQERLKRPILIENPSRYLAFAADEMEEPEFLMELCRKAGCGLLLDVNNIFVSASNLGFGAEAYVDAIDPGLVGEIHLAGHAREQHEFGDLLLDDHGSAVSAEVWALFERFVARAGARPALIEWDTRVPDYGILIAEAAKAQRILEGAGSDERAAA